jgi:hypothetical protein
VTFLVSLRERHAYASVAAQSWWLKYHSDGCLFEFLPTNSKNSCSQVRARKWLQVQLSNKTQKTRIIWRLEVWGGRRSACAYWLAGREVTDWIWQPESRQQIIREEGWLWDKDAFSGRLVAFSTGISESVVAMGVTYINYMFNVCLPSLTNAGMRAWISDLWVPGTTLPTWLIRPLYSDNRVIIKREWRVTSTDFVFQFDNHPEHRYSHRTYEKFSCDTKQ